MVQRRLAAASVIDRDDLEASATDPGPVTEETYRRVAMEDPERQWELYDGLLREKPGAGMEHNDILCYLGFALAPQLEGSKYRIRVNSARLRLPSGSYYIPDLVVVPTEYVLAIAGRPGELEYYNQSMPYISELWSRSTCDYDVNAKLPNYRLRGDKEIWRLHPYEHRLTAWRRQDDGEYNETVYTGGIVPVTALPGVEIDLDALFDVRNR